MGGLVQEGLTCMSGVVGWPLAEAVATGLLFSSEGTQACLRGGHRGFTPVTVSPLPYAFGQSKSQGQSRCSRKGDGLLTGRAAGSLWRVWVPGGVEGCGYFSHQLLQRLSLGVGAGPTILGYRPRCVPVLPTAESTSFPQDGGF